MWSDIEKESSFVPFTEGYFFFFFVKSTNKYIPSQIFVMTVGE
jgi:hypothetical protein